MSLYSYWYFVCVCVCVCVCVYTYLCIYIKGQNSSEECGNRGKRWRGKSVNDWRVYISKRTLRMNISTEKWDFTFLRALPFGDLLFVKTQFHCYLTLESYNKECCPPSVSTRIKSLATPVIDQQCILKGIQDEKQDAALYALKTGPLVN